MPVTSLPLPNSCPDDLGDGGGRAYKDPAELERLDLVAITHRSAAITQSGERNAVTRRLVTAARKMGERVDVPTPHIDTLLARRARSRYPATGVMLSLARDAWCHWLFLTPRW